jgi:hypothetical protein
MEDVLVSAIATIIVMLTIIVLAASIVNGFNIGNKK